MRFCQRTPVSILPDELQAAQSAMKVTVILCTYNRCDSLSTALESVAFSNVPAPLQWEVLIVDNNSSDNTRSVVATFIEKFPARFRYLFEPRQGKSHALNAGLRATDSDVLAFMDDDVEVDQSWLRNLTSIFSDPTWCGGGGRILPEAGFTPPRWLETSARYALAPLAIFDLGPTARELDEPPFGTNMAYRKTVFATYGGFRTDLGPQPGSEIRSEDTEFGSRLLAAGERLWYAPAAVVFHPVARERLRQAYFLRWWFDKARGDIREEGLKNGTGWTIAGIPIGLIPRLGACTARWLFSIDPARRFSRKLQVWKVAGRMAELCRRPSVQVGSL